VRLIDYIKQYGVIVNDEAIAEILSEELFLDISEIAIKIYEIQKILAGMNFENKELITTALLYVQRGLCGAEISPTTVIGKNLMLVHQGGIVIGGGTIGDNVKMHSGVVIGDHNNDTVCPTIGNGVTIYANSVVYGNISIGDGAIIGPCSVISKNVLPGQFVYGYW